MDKEYGKDLDFLKKQLAKNGNKTEQVLVVTMSLDSKIWIVSPMSEFYPAMYYLYNKTEKSVQFMYPSNKQLLNYQMTAMHTVEVNVSQKSKIACEIRKGQYMMTRMLLV